MKRYTSFLAKASVLGGALLPALVFAQGKITTFEQLVNKFITLIKYVVPLIFAIALVAFLWGIFQYFFSGAEKKEEAKDFLLYGIIGLFIMVSVWGLVRILTGTFLLENAQPNLPSLGAGGSSSGSGGSTFNTSTAGGSGVSGGGFYQNGATYPVRPTVGPDSGSSPFDTNGAISGASGASGTSNTGASGTSNTGASGTSNTGPCDSGVCSGDTAGNTSSPGINELDSAAGAFPR